MVRCGADAKGMKTATLAILLLSAATASGVTPAELDALSQIESGNRDRAVGRAGEVSRYQIMPKVWRAFGGKNPRDKREARRVARLYLEAQSAAFRLAIHRQPDAMELYFLWNSPRKFKARHMLAFMMDMPTYRRALRFAALVSAIERERKARE